MTETWLDKLCYPLEHPKYPQIKYELVKRGFNDEIIGKCAEGEIICQNNIKFEEFQSSITDVQLLQLGIPEDLVCEYILPYVSSEKGMYLNPQSYGTKLAGYLHTLNDRGWNYREIVELLRTTFEDAV